MSHYSVMVIGEDPQTQLAPYHQFECTGQEAYIQSIDKTEEYKKDYLKNYQKDPDFYDFQSFIEGYYGFKKVPLGENPILNDSNHKYGYYLVDEDDNIFKVVERTNPNYKWDYYILGGRWYGFFTKKIPTIMPLKSMSLKKTLQNVYDMTHRRSNSLLKKDIDFQSMASAAKIKASTEYDIFYDVVRGYNKPLPLEYFYTNHDKYDNPEIAYQDQEAISAMDVARKEGIIDNFNLYESYGESREYYINKKGMETVLTYAYVENGIWTERENVNYDDWLLERYNYVMGLPDNTLISIYDCHI